MGHTTPFLKLPPPRGKEKDLQKGLRIFAKSVRVGSVLPDVTQNELRFSLTASARARFVEHYCAHERPLETVWMRPDKVPESPGLSVHLLVCLDGVLVERVTSQVVLNACGLFYYKNYSLSQIVGWLPA